MFEKLEDMVDNSRNPLKYLHVKCSAVYFMINNNGNIIYIGKSLNGRLNSRIRSHEGNSKFFEEVEQIEVILFKSDVDCSIYEYYYISKFAPLYNKEKFYTPTTVQLLEGEREVYYRKGDINRKYNTTKEKRVYARNLTKEKVSENKLKRKRKRLEGYKINLVGKKFNLLTIQEVLYDECKTLYNVKSYCDCGNTTINYLSGVTNGHIKSCDCLNKLEYKSNLYQEYASLSGTLDMSIEDIHKWHERYIRVRGKLRREKMSIPDFITFMQDITFQGIGFEEVGNKKDQYSFKTKLSRYVRN